MKRTTRFPGAIGRLMLGLFIGGLLAPAVRAQTADDAFRFSQRYPATGARMMGMAGAGIAGVADYSALFSNPAGLAFFPRSEVSGSLNTLFAQDDAFFLSDLPWESETSDTRLGHLAYVGKAPTRQGSLVFAAAFNQVNTFGRELFFQGDNDTSSITDFFLPFSDEFEVVSENGAVQPRFFRDLSAVAYNGGAIEFLGENVGTGEPLFYQAVAPGTTVEQTGNVIEEGQMSEASFGGAVEATRGVMIGLSANIAFGTYRFDNFYDEIDVFDENGEDDYIVLLDDGELRGFDQVSFGQFLKTDLVGVNLRAGLAFEASRSVRFGVTLETPTFYSVDEVFSTEVETFFDDGGSLFDSAEGNFEYEITTPWRLGAGIAFVSNEAVVSGDIEVVDWSQLELDVSGDPTLFAELNRSISQEYNAVVNTRLGAEYRISDLFLRVGFAYQPDPRDENIRRIEGREIDRSKTFLSAGLGYRFDQFVIDFGWMQERFDDLYAPYTEVADAPLVDEEVARNNFALGVRYRF